MLLLKLLEPSRARRDVSSTRPHAHRRSGWCHRFASRTPSDSGHRNTLAELFVADIFECRHDSAKSYLPQGLGGFFGTTGDLCWGFGSDLAGFVAAFVGMTCVKMARFTVLSKSRNCPHRCLCELLWQRHHLVI